MQPSSELPFDFAHLVDVVPFLSTARDGDFALTIDSIERYEHGFVLVMWVEAAEGPLHLFAISARDDVGNDYVGRMVAGHGGAGGQTGWHSRVIYSFTPPLDPAVHSLALNVTHAQRLRFDHLSGVGMQPEEILGGPWEFNFDVNQHQGSRLGKALAEDREEPSSATTGSPDDLWLPLMMRNVAHGPDGFVPPPRFEPSQLRRVVPVVQRREIDGFAITMLSLEIYTDGFSAVVRTDYPEPSMRLPHQFHWQAADDRGGRYWPRGAPGSSGGFMDQTTHWRIDCQFTPALDPETRELRLWFDDAEFSDTPYGIDKPTKTVEISGRWEFVVDLR